MTKPRCGFQSTLMMTWTWESAARAAGGLSVPLGGGMTTTWFAKTGNATYNMDGTTPAAARRLDATVLRTGPSKRRRRPVSIISTDDEHAEDDEDY
jgi:hypothetical protein